MENPAFTTELDVSQGSSYGRFIAGVRDQLVLRAGARRHLELVVLRPQEKDPRKAPWFAVTLRCSSGDSVLLRIRADNLYISGYQSPAGPAGRWWEFRGGSVIDASTQLAFTDNYEDMERAAGMALEKVTLGREELEAAVRQLAAAGATAGAGQQETARSLMVVAVMICEAIRFRSVAGALGHVMCNAARRGALPAHMVLQVKNWSSLSEYWLGATLYGQPFLPRIEAETDDGSQRCAHIPQHLLGPARIDCQDHAMMALGVALNRQRPLQDKHRQALDEHWRAVRALARKLDKARRS